MAYTISPHSSSLGCCWDLHSLGVLNADISHMEANAPSLIMPCMDSYSNFLSTGYLEDALIEFSVRFKRRRLKVCSNDDNADYVSNHNQFTSQLSDDLSYLSNWTANFSKHSEELNPANLFAHDMWYSSGETMERFVSYPEVELPLLQDGILTPQSLVLSKVNSSKSNNTSVSYTSDSYSTDTSSVSDFEREERKRYNSMTTTTSSKKPTKMVYPFGLVKPGGADGDVTLKDINKRILMPPTRPLKHPVGDYACRPAVSAQGPGLSGKAVVALTRIQTQGRGTITIIRTKS